MKRPAAVRLGFAFSAFPALAALAVLLSLPARAEGKPDSRLETRFFHLHSSVEGSEAADLSGMEIRWALLDPRGSFRLVVPALALTGPSTLVSLGPAFGTYRKGAAPGSGGGSSPGGQGPGAGPLNASAVPAGAGESEARQVGLGDARLQLRRQVGRDAGWGRIFLDGGAKLPTADEQKGLGTGEADFWGGVAWRYEGWVANFETYLEWVRLGDPPGLKLQDGPGAGCFLEFPGGRGGFGVGLEAARAALEGEPARVQAVVDGYRRGGRIDWGLAASGGLSASAPDLGVSLSLRY